MNSVNIPPLISFSTINNILISIKRYNFILFFFKAAFHVNPGAVINQAVPSLYISRHIFQKFSNTSGTNYIQIVIFF